MCNRCKGVFGKRGIHRHKITCSHKDVSTYGHTSYPAKEYQVTNEEIDLGFKQEVLDSLRQDEIGKICRNDITPIRFAMFEWDSSKKKDKKNRHSEHETAGDIALPHEKGIKRKASVHGHS